MTPEPKPEGESDFYRKLRESYALSVDYDEESGEFRRFCRLVQDKLHYAVTGMSAAETLTARADATKAHMGLTSWKGAEVCESDVVLADNYLNEDEAKEHKRLSALFLEFADSQARRRRPLFGQDWPAKLDEFLRLHDQEILRATPNVVDAEAFAREQYVLFVAGETSA